MAIEVVTLTLGMVQTNCYIVGDTDSGLAVVIDPADDAPAILRAVEARQWTVARILATHAHFDHVLGADDLRQSTGASFCLHEADLPLLRAMPLTGQLFGLELPPPPDPDGFVTTGEQIVVGGLTLEVRFTPGHTPGHVSYVLPAERMVFSGDCLFQGSIGRTDLPGGNTDLLLRSIREQLLTLEDSFVVASGHGPLTTIGAERTTNPYLTAIGWG